MVRYLSGIVLLFSIALQSFDKAVVVADYYLNPSQFAKNCENTARPMLHCNGKCQMMKKLREKEKQDLLAGRLSNKSVEFTPLRFYKAIPVVHVAPVHLPDVIICIGKPIHRCSEIFHPPSLS